MDVDRIKHKIIETQQLQDAYHKLLQELNSNENLPITSLIKGIELKKSDYDDINSYKNIVAKTDFNVENLVRKSNSYQSDINVLGILIEKSDNDYYAKVFKSIKYSTEKFTAVTTSANLDKLEEFNLIIAEANNLQKLIERQGKKELERIKKEKGRILKFIGDFKSMAKMFAKDSPMREATLILVDAYEKLLGYLS